MTISAFPMNISATWGTVELKLYQKVSQNNKALGLFETCGTCLGFATCLGHAWVYRWLSWYSSGCRGFVWAVGASWCCIGLGSVLHLRASISAGVANGHCRKRHSWAHPGTILGPSWDHFGSLVVHFDHLRSILGNLGAS